MSHPGILNRSLFAVAAMGLVCTTLVPPSGMQGTLAWCEPLPFVGTAALLSTVGYRMAARQAAGIVPQGVLGGVLGVVLRSCVRVLPGLALGILLDMILVRPGAARLSPIAPILRQHPAISDFPAANALAQPVAWMLVALALASLPVLLGVRAIPRPRAAALLALLALLSGVAGWIFAGNAMPGAGMDGSGADGSAFLSGIAFMLAGAALHEAVPSRAALFRADLVVLCFVVTTLCAAWLAADGLPLLWLTVPIMSVAAAGLLDPREGDMGPDPTLGIAVLALPLLGVLHDGVWTWPEALAAVLLLSLGWGFVSWFLIERPALRLLQARMRAS